ncbi:MAG: DUF5693 family protein [bacterium]
MRVILYILALVYFLIRFFFADITPERFFILDYDEAIDFVSSYTDNPEGYVEEKISPNFNAVSIRLKSLSELRAEGKVDLATLESLRIDPKSWMMPLSNRLWEKQVCFAYFPLEKDLSMAEKALRSLKIDCERYGNILVVYGDSKYIFNLQIFVTNEIESISKDKKVLWRVSSLLYNLSYLDDLVKAGDMIIFTGPFVAGYPSEQEMNEVVKYIELKGLTFVFPEFYDSRSVQSGANFIAQKKAIKLFSTIVLKNKTPEQIIGSIDTAINERNCQAVLFRFFERFSLSQNIQIIERIKNQFYTNYQAENYEFLQLISVISYVYLLFFALLVFVSYSYYHEVISANGYVLNSVWFIVIAVLNSVGMIVSKVLKIYWLFNLLIVLGVSVVLVALFFRIFESHRDTLVRYIEIIICSISMGVIVNSMIYENMYAVGIQKVGFIKLLLLLPIAYSIFAVFSLNEIRLFLLRRMRVIDFLGFVLAVGILSLYLLRSGNCGIIFPYEDKIRNLMDKVFIARPRFKEFLVGDPSILASSYSKFFIPLAFIGVVSIVDSFLHIHTPIFYSLLRTIWGAVIGFVLFLIVKRIIEVKMGKGSKINSGYGEQK